MNKNRSILLNSISIDRSKICSMALLTINNLERSRAEFPMSSVNFYKEDTLTFQVSNPPSPTLDAKCLMLTPKVFEVERLTKQQRAEAIIQSFLSKDSGWDYSSNNSSRRYGKRRCPDDKLKEIELTERHSDITMDKSNLSFVIQNGNANGDMIEEIDDLLSGKKVEQDYYSSVNMLSGVALPGLSNDSAWDDGSVWDSNSASGSWFGQEDWVWEAQDNDNCINFINKLKLTIPF